MNIFRKAIFIMGTSALLQGCMTMGALKGAADQAAEGNIFAAAYGATFAILLGPIVDVVTLGGTLTDDQAAAGLGAVTAAANSQTAAVPATSQVAANGPMMGSQSSEDYVSRPVVIGVPEQNISVASRNNPATSGGAGSCPLYPSGATYEQKLAFHSCDCKGPGTSFTQTGTGFTCRFQGAIRTGCSKASNTCLTQ